MVSKNAMMSETERLEQWANNAVVSLSASLVFGRERASEIAQPLLLALFTMTSNDYKKALNTIVNIVIQMFPSGNIKKLVPILMVI